MPITRHRQEAIRADRWKFFDILHRDHALCNPTDPAKVDEMLGLLRLPPGSSAVDIASGKGEVALRLAERYEVSVRAVDLSPYAVREAQARASGRRLHGSVDFALGEGSTFPVAPASQDLAMCIGASWIFGGHRGTLRALAAMVRPRAFVLVGEPFWRTTPSEAYLEAIGHGEFASHAENVAAGQAVDLTALYALESSQHDWDRYEGLQWQAAERYAAEHPEDADVPELLTVCRHRRDIYLREGRAAMGWALYLFQRR